VRIVYLLTAFVAVLIVSVFGFRGRAFTSPPMDVFPEWAFPGMRDQPKLRPQSQSAFFADGRADRPIPANTVARGEVVGDDVLALGKDAAGEWVRGIPADLNVDLAFLQRGQGRYQIYCAPCHGELGDGKGITSNYGMVPANFQDPRLRDMADGQIYNAIINGSPNGVMLPYADKLTVDDRWAVVAYVRTLQRAQGGTAADVTDAAARTELGLP